MPYPMHGGYVLYPQPGGYMQFSQQGGRMHYQGYMQDPQQMQLLQEPCMPLLKPLEGIHMNAPQKNSTISTHLLWLVWITTLKIWMPMLCVQVTD